MRGLRAAALALSLAACAVGGPMTPPPPPGAVEVGADRVGDLALGVWAPAGAPRSAILALHGFGDYGPSTFGAAAAYWAERGHAVYAYDHRGFGRSPQRGQWPGAARLVEDAVAVAGAVRRRHPGAPLTLIGHSMGGGVALTAAPAIRPDRLVLAAPAVWGGDTLGPHYRALAWSGALLFPDRRWTGDGLVEIRASDNAELLRRLARDPLVIGSPSSREFMGLIRLMDMAVAAAPEVEAPTLVLYGEKDEVTPVGPVRAAHAALGGPKRLVTYPDGWHMLFRDLQAPRVWRDVADWIEETP